MQVRGGVVFGLVVFLAISPMGAASFSTASSDTPSLNTTFAAGPTPDSPITMRRADQRVISTTSGSSEVVVIELHDNGTSKRGRLADFGVELEATAGTLVQGRIPAADRSGVEALPWVRAVRTPTSAHPVVVSEGVPAMDADRVQASGVTGQNVSVGVIDTGFDPSNEEIADNVVDTRSFTGDLRNGGDDRHGTAVSEIVLDTAPNASLYLANIDTMVEFANAVDWMLENEVDVISVSLTWYAAPHDGTSLVSRKATEAADAGTVTVIAAGNAAEAHWDGPYADGDGDQWANFTDETERNYLNDGNSISAGTQIDVYLTWDDWVDPSANYDLYLFRDNPNATDEVIDSQTRDQTIGLDPYEHIAGTFLESGRYYLAIRNEDAPGAEDLELVSVDGDLLIATASGSITAPAVAKNVTGVGAFNYATGDLESFSSHGPTNDGRRGVDVTGPDGVTTTAYGGAFFGTSAAAPHVSGLAGLVLAKNPTLSPSQVEHVLTRTATDMGATGVDDATGHGRVNASDAVDRSVASITPTALSVSPDVTTVGTAVRVNATVANTGLVDGNETITLLVDDRPAENRTMGLEGDETRIEEFTHAFGDIGDHTVTVGALPPVNVSVPSHIEFENQAVENGSRNMTVATANATRSYSVEITTTNGTVLGTTDAIGGKIGRTNLSVALTNALERSQRLTATVRAVDDGSALGSDDAAITVVGGSVLDRYDDNADNRIDTIELLDGIQDFRSGSLDVTGLLDLIDVWRSS